MKKTVWILSLSLIMTGICTACNNGNGSIPPNPSAVESSVLTANESSQPSKENDISTIIESHIPSRQEDSRTEIVSEKPEVPSEMPEISSDISDISETAIPSDIEEISDGMEEDIRLIEEVTDPPKEISVVSEQESEVSVIHRQIDGFYNLVEMMENGEVIANFQNHNDRGLYITFTANADGTGQWDEFGNISPVQWNDTYIIRDGEQAEYDVDGDTLLIYDDGKEMVFEKTDRESLIPPQESREEPSLSGKTDISVAGRYIMGNVSDETVFSEEVYLTLYEDGTGTLGYDDEILAVQWTEKFMKLNGEIISYTLENDTLTAEIYGLPVTFQRVE